MTGTRQLAADYHARSTGRRWPASRPPPSSTPPRPPPAWCRPETAAGPVRQRVAVRRAEPAGPAGPPHSAAMQPDVIRPGYDEAGLLRQVDVWLQQAAAPAALLDPATAEPHAVTAIDYNARGQRISIGYGNGTTSAYGYDPQTFRLTSLTTTRPARSPPPSRPSRTCPTSTTRPATSPPSATTPTPRTSSSSATSGSSRPPATPTTRSTG